MKHLSPKIALLLAMLSISAISGFSQDNSTIVNSLIKREGVDVSKKFDLNQSPLFTVATSYTRSNAQEAVKGVYLNLNRNAINSITNNAPKTLSITLPTENGDGSSYTLQLVKISNPSFKVKNSKNEYIQYNNTSVHYQGVIVGLKRSLAAISFLKNGEVAGLISHSKSNLVLAKVRKDDRHILYEDRQVNDKLDFTCFIDDRPTPVESLDKNSQNRSAASTSGCKVVRVYFELDNDLFVRKSSSIDSTVAYMTAVFNQVQLLYNNDDIEMEISEIKVWDTIDPYASITSTSLLVNQFSTNLNGAYDGDIAHFISGRISTLGGGIAYTIPLEICTKAEQCCVSAIYDYYSDIPTYSWTVNVITHEMGHILGSRHTHWCGWPGGPIDGCSGFAESDSSGNSCSIGPIPSIGGTIMSYCHQSSVGINSSLGFGPYPQSIIKYKINQAACLTSLGSDLPPNNPLADSIKMTSAILKWDTISGSPFYEVEYKPSAASIWESAGVSLINSLELAGLQAQTSYDWRVKSICSEFTSTSSFTTLLNDLIFESFVTDSLQVGVYFQVPFRSANFSDPNVFELQLSDNSGLFSNPLTIGSISRDSSGIITGYIPPSIVTGNNFKLRVVGSNPNFSSESSKSFKVLNYATKDSITFEPKYPTETSLRIFAESKDSTGAYYIIDYPTLNDPTASQIRAGLNSSGFPAYRKGVLNLKTINEAYSKIVDELSPGQEYVIFVGIDSSNMVLESVLSKYTNTSGTQVQFISPCSPLLDCTDGDLINDVIIPGLGIFKLNSGCSTNGHDGNTNTTYALFKDSTYTFEINTNNSWKEYLDIWIDFNQDGIFTNTEVVYSSPSREYGFVDSFNIPSTANLGLTTLRIKMSFADSTRNQACQSNGYFGEVEDYKILIRKNCEEAISLVSSSDDINAGIGRIYRGEQINASNKINGPSASDFYGKKSITLLPGFSSNDGSIFKAEIDSGCGENSYN